MLPFISDHPMLCALALILIDIVVWRLFSASSGNWKLVARLVIFATYSAVLFNDGMNPMQIAPYADNTPCTWPPPPCRLVGGCLPPAP